MKMAKEITLNINGISVMCDKSKLMEKSGYFRSMFTSGMQESEMDVVELKESDIVQQLVNSLEDSLEVTPENVYDLLHGAMVYQFDSVVETCSAHLESTLSHFNCLQIMQISDSLSLDRLFHISKVHSLWYFETLTKDIEILAMSKEYLILYLSNKWLNCLSELSVFCVLCRWFEYQTQDVDAVRREVIACQIEHSDRRTILFCELLRKCLYLDSMSLNELHTTLNHSLVKNEEKAKELFLTEIEKRKKLSDSQTAIVRSRRQATAIVCFRGRFTEPGTCPDPSICDEPATDFLYVDPDECTVTVINSSNSNAELGKHCMKAIGCQITLIDRQIFVTGGELILGRNTWQMKVVAWDCFTNRWSHRATLRQPKRHHASCSRDEKLFIIGGFGRYRKILDSIESYNTETGEWVDYPPMLKMEFSATAVACNDALYVFKTHIQQFSFGTSTWSFVTINQPLSANVSFALQYMDVIYLCCKINKTLRMFDTKTQEYTEVGRFDFDNSETGKGCVLLNHKIYFLGHSPAPSIESYDILLKKFEFVGKLKNGNDLQGEVITAPRYPTFYPSTLASTSIGNK